MGPERGDSRRCSITESESFGLKVPSQLPQCHIFTSCDAHLPIWCNEVEKGTGEER